MPINFETTPPKRKYFSRKEAATFLREMGLRIGPSRLAVLAITDEGPPYKRFGRSAIYSAAELVAWAESRLIEPRTANFDNASQGVR